MLQSQQSQIILSLLREDKDMRRYVPAATTFTQGLGWHGGLGMGCLEVTAVLKRKKEDQSPRNTHHGMKRTNSRI